MGRPSKFVNYEKKKSIISLMYQRGFIDKEIAKVLDVSKKTLENWKAKNKNFLPTLKGDKQVADDKVQKALYERALGYEYKEITIEYIKIGKAKTPAKKTKEVIKQLAPDTTAQIFWLKNRQPDKWRDKKEVTLTELTKEERNAELIKLKALLS